MKSNKLSITNILMRKMSNLYIINHKIIDLLSFITCIFMCEITLDKNCMYKSYRFYCLLLLFHQDLSRAK